jgi:hypothetical protein
MGKTTLASWLGRKPKSNQERNNRSIMNNESHNNCFQAEVDDNSGYLLSNIENLRRLAWPHTCIILVENLMMEVDV